MQDEPCGRRRSGRPVDRSASGRRSWRPPFSPHAFIDTDKGTIEIELAVLDAPLTVGNFIALARKGFFNGVADPSGRARLRRAGRRSARRRRRRARATRFATR